MTVITRFIVQGFRANAWNEMKPFPARYYDSPDLARDAAQELAEKERAALAFSWEGDPDLGEEGSVTLLAKFGPVPDEVLEGLGL